MSMEELVLNRLMDLAAERERAMQRRFEALSAEFEHIKRERDSLRETVANQREGEKPLRDFYLAAENYLEADTPSRRTRGRDALTKAMKAANPFIDHIPF